MKIGKILNNNVVVVYEKEQPEKIIMGCGIAFHKKIGDIIDETKIDKIFSLINPDTNLRLQQLLCDIPIEYVNITEKIIKYAKTKTSRNLNEFIYITLLDHIYMAILRQKEGISTKNIMLWDIKKFYKEEFEIGLQALKFIDEAFNIKLIEDEAGFIALHIVNAQMDNDYNAIKEISEVTNLIHQIVTIVTYHFQIKLNEDSVYFYRFITHLKFFSLRLFQKSIHQSEQDEDLLTLIKKKYKSSYECTLKIVDYIEKKYSYEISEEEILYLTIHIERIQKENSKNKQSFN